MNWNQNAQNCCSLGMEPIFFSSVEQQQCISNLTSSMQSQFYAAANNKNMYHQPTGKEILITGRVVLKHAKACGDGALGHLSTLSPQTCTGHRISQKC